MKSAEKIYVFFNDEEVVVLARRGFGVNSTLKWQERIRKCHLFQRFHN